MRFFLFILISLPVFAAEYKGPCSKLAMNHALKDHRKAVRDFSLRLPQNESPAELHIYEVAFTQNKRFYHGEVSVEHVRGRCQKPVLQYITQLD